MKKVTLFSSLAVLTVLSGCVPRVMFETEPVQIPTTKGIVTCQLYSQDITWWDHAISRPRLMSADEADDICFEMGKRVSNN